MSGQTTRCFVAVLLPDRVRAGLAAVCDELRGQTHGLAWVRPDNLHLTLRFLGEVEPVMLERVREAVTVAAFAVPPFTVSLGGLGGFPSAAAPRVLWASVGTGADRLVALHAALEAGLVGRGLPPEPRPFHPHVTLARTRDPRAAGGLAGVLGSGPAFGDTRVTELHLMRSELGRGGARYSVLAAVPLRELSGEG